jgi:hypothetical protein
LDWFNSTYDEDANAVIKGDNRLWNILSQNHNTIY